MSIWSSENSLIIIKVVSISTSRWLESFVIKSWVEGCSSTSLAWGLLGGSTEVSDLATDQETLRHL